MLVLGIETSCDETGVAVVENGKALRSNVIADQQLLHARFGGVVPEVASRAHVDLLHPAVEQACAEAGVRLADIDAIAVTIGPGLAGSLLVGVAAAKSYALALDRPLIGVNHLIAHVYANVLDHGSLPAPAIVFVVSGGHTSLLVLEADGGFRMLGQTIDDAAGEAYDKVARVQVSKILRAAAEEGLDTVLLAGGVAANSRLRAKLERAAGERHVRVLAPSPRLCTDNGAMVACAGTFALERGERTPLDVGADPNLRIVPGVGRRAARRPKRHAGAAPRPR